MPGKAQIATVLDGRDLVLTAEEHLGEMSSTRPFFIRCLVCHYSQFGPELSDFPESKPRCILSRSEHDMSWEMTFRGVCGCWAKLLCFHWPSVFAFQLADLPRATRSGQCWHSFLKVLLRVESVSSTWNKTLFRTVCKVVLRGSRHQAQLSKRPGVLVAAAPVAGNCGFVVCAYARQRLGGTSHGMVRN